MNQHHPDDELLSAALDGESGPGTVAHLGGCDACLARLDALDRVRRSVAADPGPTPAALADRVMAAAAAAWAGEQAAATVPVPRPEPAAGARAPTPPPPPRAAEGAGAAGGDHKVVPLHRRSDRRAFPAWALGAVAAVVAALLAVPIVLDDDDSDTGQRTASAPAGDQAANASSLDAGVVEGGELGSLSDPATLREQLLAAVPGAVAQKASAPASAEGAADTLAAPAPEAPSTTAFAARTAGGAEATGTACRAEVRAQFGGRLGALLYTAGLRWQGTDAVVLAYRLADTSAPGPDHLALVMARDDCRLLASQGF